MKEFIKNNWLKFIIAIPIALQVIGNLVNNLYLMKYDILDINPFKSIQIMTGVFFVGIHLIYFFAFAIDTDLIEPHKNRYLLLKTLLKISILSNATFIFLSFDKVTEIKFLIIHISDDLQRSFLFSSFMLYGIRSFINLRENKDDYIKWQIIAISIFKIFLSTISILISLLLYFNNKYYSEICNYILLLGILFYVIQFARSEIQLKRKDPEYEPKFNFTGDGSYITLDLFFAYFCFFIAFTSLISSYAKSIYPLLPTNLGGAKQIEMVITTEEDIVQGKIIYQNEKYIYINMDEHTHLIKRDTIKSFIQKKDL